MKRRHVDMTAELREKLIAKLCEGDAVIDLAKKFKVSQITVNGLAALPDVVKIVKSRRKVSSQKASDTRSAREPSRSYDVRRGDQQLSDDEKEGIRTAYLRGDETDDIAAAYSIPKTYVVAVACYAGDIDLRRRNRAAARRVKKTASPPEIPSHIVEAVKMLRSGGMLINDIYKEVGISRSDVRDILKGRFKTTQ